MGSVRVHAHAVWPLPHCPQFLCQKDVPCSADRNLYLSTVFGALCLHRGGSFRFHLGQQARVKKCVASVWYPLRVCLSKHVRSLDVCQTSLVGISFAEAVCAILLAMIEH